MQECSWEIGRPSGTSIISFTSPSAEALGYFRSPLRGWFPLKRHFGNEFSLGLRFQQGGDLLVTLLSGHHGWSLAIVIC